MGRMRAVDAMLAVLQGAGVRHLFGNPGSMEFPIVDALARQEAIRYILGLHEVAVMGMADGYAQASGGLGVANVHISPGLGNAMGMLYNAWRAGTPLLLTAGQADRRLAVEEPVLWSELARVAAPLTKMSVEVQRAEDLPRIVRRAVVTALTPPTGPVFLGLPMDLQVEEGDYDTSAPLVPDRRVRPASAAIEAAVKVLAGARRPAILAGCRVVESGASAALGRVAEALGAVVYSDPVTSHGRLSLAADHPLYAGALPLFASESRPLLAQFDVVLAVGMDLIVQYFHRGAGPLPESVRLVQLDSHSGEIGKNYVPEVGLVGDVGAGLAELEAALAGALSASFRRAATRRIKELTAEHTARRAAFRAAGQAEWSRRPLSAVGLMAAVEAGLPPETVIVDEAVTASRLDFERSGWLRDPRAYFGHRGWGLGWGVGVALGVALAWPGRPVVGLLGEGSLLYGVQGLWTAAHYGLPVVYVVANNASYAILKAGMLAAKLPSALAGNWLGMDLVGPEPDYVGLARSLGIAASRVETASEITEAVAAAVRAGKPALIEIPIDRTLGEDRR